MLSIKKLFKRGYSQNSVFLIICGTLFAMSLLRLDVLLGAVGLRSVYTVAGFVAFAVLALAIIVVSYLWNTISSAWSIVLGIVFIVGLLIISPYLIVIGWGAGIVVRLLPAQLLPLGLLVAIAVWIWQIRRPRMLDRLLVVRVTAGVMLFASIFALGVGALPENAERSSRDHSPR